MAEYLCSIQEASQKGGGETSVLQLNMTVAAGFSYIAFWEFGESLEWGGGLKEGNAKLWQMLFFCIYLFY
jgi:hypothetical protein